jgi:hypothetical protein
MQGDPEREVGKMVPYHHFIRKHVEVKVAGRGHSGEESTNM